MRPYRSHRPAARRIDVREKRVWYVMTRLDPRPDSTDPVEPSGLGRRWEERLFHVAALVSGLVAAALAIGPTLARPTMFDGDARQHVYWLYRYADPTLFPGDISVEYFSSRSVAPLGYQAIYALLAAHIDALLAAKFVAVVLYVVTLLLAWLLGRSLVRQRKSLAGLVALIGVVLIVWVVDAILPPDALLPALGLQRAFSLPLVLLTLWGLTSRKYLWVGISWVLAALVYPVMIPVLGLTSGVVFLVDLIRDRRLPPMWQWNAVLGVAAIAIVVFGSGMPEGVGPMVTHEQVKTMAEFGPEGRQSLFDEGGWQALFYNGRTGLGWGPESLLPIAGAVGFAWLYRRRNPIPLPPWVLLGVGAGLWFVARLTLLHLYLPNRHSRYAIAAFGLVAFCIAGVTLVNALTERIGGSGKLAALGVSVLAPLVVVCALLPGAMNDEWLGRPAPGQEAVYAYISKLPRDTLVVAHPDVADDIPLMTRRSVLASTEQSIAFATGYYERLVPRIEASLEAAYATSWDGVDAALEPYGADIIVVRACVYEQHDPYYAPFQALTRKLWDRGQGKGFILAEPPKDRVLLQRGDFTIVRVESTPEVTRQPSRESIQPVERSGRPGNGCPKRR